MVSYDVACCQGKPFDERTQFAIAELGMPVRVSNRLEDKLGVLWIENLRGITRDAIRALPSFGVKMMRDLDARLAKAGVKLEEDGTLTDLHLNGNGHVSAKQSQ